MQTRIIKNLTAGAVYFPDLGNVECPASGVVDVTDLFQMGELDKSVTLRAAISAGTVCINDGTSDLSMANSLLAITTFAIYDADQRYINEAELTLQKAYDGPSGSGSGRQVTASSGPIKITSGGNYAPFELPPVGAAPSVGLADGQVCVYGGRVYVYDNTRTLWVSTTRAYPTFGRQGNADGLYLRIGGDVQDPQTGWQCVRDAVLMGVTARETGGNATKAFEVRKNNGTLVQSFSLTASNYRVENLNVNLSAGDYLMVWASDAGTPATSPVVSLEIGWRL